MPPWAVLLQNPEDRKFGNLNENWKNCCCKEAKADACSPMNKTPAGNTASKANKQAFSRGQKSWRDTVQHRLAAIKTDEAQAHSARGKDLSSSMLKPLIIIPDIVACF